MKEIVARGQNIDLSNEERPVTIVIGPGARIGAEHSTETKSGDGPDASGMVSPESPADRRSREAILATWSLEYISTSGLRLHSQEGLKLLGIAMPKFKCSPPEFNRLRPSGTYRVFGQQYWQKSLDAMTEWENRIKEGHRFIEKNGLDYEPPGNKERGGWTTDADCFIDYAEWHGWRMALCLLFGAGQLDEFYEWNEEETHAPITHESTALWARLQQRCCEVYLEQKEDRFDRIQIWTKDGDLRIADDDVFRLAFPILYHQTQSDWKDWRAIISKLNAVAPDDVSYCTFWPDCPMQLWHKGGPHFIPRSLRGKRGLLNRIKQHAWKNIRALPGRMRPAEPDRIADLRHLIRELDKVILWCEQCFEPSIDIPVKTVVTDQTTKRAHLTRPEYNVICRDFLEKRMQKTPLPTVREVQKAVGCGTKTLYKLPSFVAVRSELEKGRKPKKPKTVSLSPAVHQGDDELERLIGEQRSDDNFRVRTRQRS
jgi:hypothetical protein